jgi:hypothetical protein
MRAVGRRQVVLDGSLELPALFRRDRSGVAGLDEAKPFAQAVARRAHPEAAPDAMDERHGRFGDRGMDEWRHRVPGVLAAARVIAKQRGQMRTA